MHLGDILPLLFQILSLNIGTSTYRVFHNENGIKMKDSVHLSFFKANSEINEIFWGVSQPPGKFMNEFFIDHGVHILSKHIE